MILSVNNSLTELEVCGNNLRPRERSNHSYVLKRFSLFQLYAFREDPIGLYNYSFIENFVAAADDFIHTIPVKEVCPFKNSQIFSHYIDCNGGVYYYKNHDVALFIPPNSVPEGIYVEIKVSSSLLGPFELPDSYKPISSFVWVGADYQFQQPVYLIMSHFANIDNSNTIESVNMFEACKLLDNEVVNGCCTMRKVENCFVDADLNYCVYSTDHFCSFCLAHDGPVNSFAFIALYYNYSEESLKATKYSADFRFCHQNVRCIEVRRAWITFLCYLL